MWLGYADAVLNLHGPVADQAAREFVPALTELRARPDLGGGPIGCGPGRSAPRSRSWSSPKPTSRSPPRVLVGPLVQLRAAVEALVRRYRVTYSWSEESLQGRDGWASSPGPARSLGGQPAVLLVVGGEDESLVASRS